VEVFQIEARTERRAGARDDHDVARLAGGEVLQRMRQVLHQLMVERVPLFGAVEKDGMDAGFGVRLNRGVM
jgi:hypothetical protein